MRPLYEAVGWVLFKKFNAKSVYTFLANAMPLYSTGMDTGIVVDCGF